jgi:CubicO group peptidase (beta-lactamase class C family)
VGLSIGFVRDGFEPVRDLFEEHLADGRDLGASIAVHHHGDVVVDIWGGFADSDKTRPWAEDTIVNVWSTTKTMTFLVSLVLADRGELDFDAPVARYWPEFAQAGKDDVRFRHVLSHTAGLSGWTEALKMEDLADWERCVSALAAQEPWWEPGTASGYHAVTQGYLIGEVVRRITGDTIGTFFRRELAEPLGADFFIGLPESEEGRVSLVVPPPPADFSSLDPNSIAVRTLTSPPISATAPHNRWWRAAEIPAANGHGNARAVALLQSAITNGGEVNGRRLLRSETVDRVFEELHSGDDLVLGMPMRFGAGYGLASETLPIGPRACFWGGFGGSIIIMDQQTGLTIAYMMNRMDTGLVGDTRGMMLAMAAASAVEGVS